MVTKHIPGPWFVFGNGHCVGGPCEIAGCPTAGIAMCGMRARDGDECEANARLIAAAPDLLATCKEAIEFIELNHQETSIAVELRDAVAKAEGGAK